MERNERNAGRKSKFKKGVTTFVIADKLPKILEKQIRFYIKEIIEPYLNDEPIKSKKSIK